MCSRRPRFFSSSALHTAAVILVSSVCLLLVLQRCSLLASSPSPIHHRPLSPPPSFPRAAKSDTRGEKKEEKRRRDSKRQQIARRGGRRLSASPFCKLRYGEVSLQSPPDKSTLSPSNFPRRKEKQCDFPSPPLQQVGRALIAIPFMVGRTSGTVLFPERKALREEWRRRRLSVGDSFSGFKGGIQQVRLHRQCVVIKRAFCSVSTCIF